MLKRFFPKDVFPLISVGILALMLTALAYINMTNGQRIVAGVLCVALLILLALIYRRIVQATSIIRNSGLLNFVVTEPSLIELLHLLIDEASDQNNLKYSAALANTQAEIDALQSQINPHFLYNTLDSIRGQALIDNSPIVADMTEALSIIFRYSISRQGNLVTLHDELRCIEKYLMIQQFRFAGKFRFEKQLDESLLGCLIPRLTLQPIVENAIYHGLESKNTDGIIKIVLYRCGSYMVVQVRDNGVGMSEMQLLTLNEKLQSDTSMPLRLSQKGSGIALCNVNRRIRLVFGTNFGIIAHSTPDIGTDMEVILPILYEDGAVEGRP